MYPTSLLNLLDRIGPGRKVLNTEPAAIAGQVGIGHGVAVNPEFPSGQSGLSGIANTIAVEILILGDAERSRQALAAERITEIEAHHPGVILDVEINLPILQVRKDIGGAAAADGKSRQVERQLVNSLGREQRAQAP